MAITFYSAPRSSASPVAFALAELGIDHETITFDLKGDAHKQPDFLALNPMGQVPTLVDDGQAMFESSACIIYLGDKYGVDRGLWPAIGSREQMQALTWIAWSAVTLGSTIRQCFVNGPWAPEEMRNARQLEAARGRFDELLAIIDRHLDGRDYVTGADFCLADCYIGSAIGWVAGVLEHDMSKTPNLGAYVGRVMARDGARAMD